MTDRDPRDGWRSRVVRGLAGLDRGWWATAIGLLVVALAVALP